MTQVLQVADERSPAPASSTTNERSLLRRFRPVTWLMVGFVRLWRWGVSPLYGDVCKYWPTCSAYGLESVVRHGAVRGLGLTVRRLLRCHPWAAGGIDRVPQGGRRFSSETELPRIILLNHPTPADRAAVLTPRDPAHETTSARQHGADQAAAQMAQGASSR